MDLPARILCALILVFSVLAQPPAGASMPVMPEMAAYVLPDGSFADLCLTGHDAQDGKGGTSSHACQSCCLAAPVALPTPQAFQGRFSSEIFVRSSLAAELLLARPVLLAGLGPRAPPQFLA